MLTHYQPVYTFARSLRKSSLSKKVDKWQKKKNTQTFVADMLKNAAKFGMRACKVNKAIGKGLITRNGIPKGKQFGLYYGELTSIKAVKNPQGDYLMHFPHFKKPSRLILDGESKIISGKVEHSNISYANHSCRKYNCEMVSVQVGWGAFIVLQSIKRIAPGEPLLVNYDHAYDTKHPYWQRETYAGEARDTATERVMRCMCKTPRCPFLCYRMVDK